MKKAALYVALAVLGAACASKDVKQEAPAVSDRSTPVAPVASAGRSTTSPTTSPMVTGNPLRDPSNILSKRSVYFDFDSNQVKDEFRGLVQAHSRYMTSDKRDSRIRIEGNCDERGSREYNLALGQKRSEAVKRMLLLLGAREDQVEAVSLGEEKPKSEGHTEEAWAQNRRGDILYQGEY